MKILSKRLLSVIFISAIVLSFTAVSATDMSIQWAYMDLGESSIEGIGNCQVLCWGDTQSYMTVNYIEVKVFLQVFENGDWNTIRTETFGVYSDWMAEGCYTATVEPFACYRVLSEHRVIHNGITEYTTSVTNSVSITE